MSGGGGARPDLLEAIVAATRCAVAERTSKPSRPGLERAAAARAPRGSAFVEALRRPDRYNVIAECKRRSPSRGVIREVYRPEDIAVGYVAAGAAAVSVLTEPAFFDGGLAHLAAVRARVSLPLLQKDFILSEHQLLEGRASGADAVLLIVAALDDETLRGLARAARGLDLAVLTEVHDRRELDRALDAGADVIGVNNRDLRTLAVDLTASRELIVTIPEEVVAVAESGLRTGSDLAALRETGYDAFLIGESLMRRPSPGGALATLLDEAGAPEHGIRRAVARVEEAEAR